MFPAFYQVTDEEILAYYSDPNCQGVPFRASSYLGVGVRRIQRVWGEHGKEPLPLLKNPSKRKQSCLLGIEPPGPLAKLSEKDLEFIVNRHDRYHGIPRLAARSMPYRTEVIKAAWEQAGKEIKRYDPARIDTPLVLSTYWK